MFLPENFNRARDLGAVAAILLCAAACDRGPQATEPVAVVGATLIDVTAGVARPDAVVVIRDGRFACVGNDATCPIPADARVIDGRGLWITPGFIDTHVHLWWQQDSVWTATAQRLRLSAGITTVREMGSSHQLSAVLAHAPEARDDTFPSPRVFVSGRIAQGVDQDGGPRRITRLIEELVGAGVDGLKIKSKLPPDVMVRALEEAEQRGYAIYGHPTDIAASVDELERAFALGLDGVVHVRLLAELIQPPGQRVPAQAGRPIWIDLWKRVDPALEDRLISAMLAEGVWLEPTLAGMYLQLEPDACAGAPSLRVLPPGLAERLAADSVDAADRDDAWASLRRMADLVAAFKARGGTITVGTDMTELPALGPHLEMELLVDLVGLSPAEALRAATSDAANVLGWSDRLGTIEEGKIADMVLLAADPRADIRNTRTIRLVFKGGVPHDPVPLQPEPEENRLRDGDRDG